MVVHMATDTIATLCVLTMSVLNVAVKIFGNCLCA